MTSKINRYLAETVKFLDRLSGHSARDWKMQSEVLTKAEKEGTTAARAKRQAIISAGRSFQTRAKAGATTAALGTSGFLGLHKYHQHKDNQILKKIDSMYPQDSTQE